MTTPLPTDTYIIPSKYFSTLEKRRLHLSPARSSLQLYTSDGISMKRIPLNRLQKVQANVNRLVLTVDNGRTYEVMGEVQRLFNMITLSKMRTEINDCQEYRIELKPKSIDYEFYSKESVFDDACGIKTPRATMTFSHLKSTSIKSEDIDQNKTNDNGNQPDHQEISHNSIYKSNQNHNDNHQHEHQHEHQHQHQHDHHKQYLQPPIGSHHHHHHHQNHSLRTSYINLHDWRLSPEKGVVLFINEDKRGNLGKVAAFVIKKLISTGSFMGISYPVFAMKPQSILQTYAKAFGSAPHLLTKHLKADSHANIPLQTLKNYLMFLVSVSVLLLDLDKPFNPLLGETFQCRIGNGQFSAEQILHHPPISSVLYVTDQYRIYGNLQLSASVGLNSANGRFAGDLTLEYKNGEKLIGRIPGGILSGFIFGDTKFQATGGSYVYDTRRDLVGCYYSKGKSRYEGFIGALKEKDRAKFMECMAKPDRFTNFQQVPQKKYRQIHCSVTIDWARQIRFSNEHSFSFLNQDTMPFIPVRITEKAGGFPLLLESDSSYRPDIPLRIENRMEESQQAKEALEEDERKGRKMREAHLKERYKKTK